MNKNMKNKRTLALILSMTIALGSYTSAFAGSPPNMLRIKKVSGKGKK